jgi:hypothetical protein
VVQDARDDDLVALPVQHRDGIASGRAVIASNVSNHEDPVGGDSYVEAPA